MKLLRSSRKLFLILLVLVGSCLWFALLTVDGASGQAERLVFETKLKYPVAIDSQWVCTPVQVLPARGQAAFQGKNIAYKVRWSCKPLDTTVGFPPLPCNPPNPYPSP